jgi:hypothetical protein
VIGGYDAEKSSGSKQHAVLHVGPCYNDDIHGGDEDSQQWSDSVAEEAGEADSLLAG